MHTCVRYSKPWLSCFVITTLSMGTLAGVSKADTNPAYLWEVLSGAEFEALSQPAQTKPEMRRVSKYLSPIDPRDPELLDTVFQNVNQYPMHYEFLVNEFPDRFAGLTMQEYLAMINRRETRQYFAGGVYEFETNLGERVYGFDVYTDRSRPAELLSATETLQVYTQLSESFALRPWAYSPITTEAVVAALDWQDPPFPVYITGQVAPASYEAYHRAINYGQVRLLTLEELEQVNELGGLSWQEIIVLDGTPADLEGVVAGIITGQPQGELSHINVRSARRGTPNAYVHNAHTAFAPYNGQLVRLEVAAGTYRVDTDVTIEQAENWWAQHRPLVSSIVFPDRHYRELASLDELGHANGNDQLVSRVGGKAANLARMFTYLPPQHQVAGFTIPFAYEQDFLSSNHIADYRSSPPVMRTYREYLELLMQDQQFLADPAYRASELRRVRHHIENNGRVDPELVASIAQRIEEVFGSTLVRTRFRSSSNVEDDLVFIGAGLYDSTAVCAEDTLDGGTGGASNCYPHGNRRTIERGLKRVWASLWNFRAWEERAYYQIPHERAGMAIVVTTAFPDQAADGVAFTGNPLVGTSSDYLINVQIGNESVANPDPGVLPERSLLTLTDGIVTNIRRVRPSTLMPPGEHVLNDQQLERLGALMHVVKQNHPFDPQGFDLDRIMFDIEFKLTHDDEIQFKQVRPFLAGEINPSTVAQYYRVEIPHSMTSCGQFVDNRTIQDEHQLQIMVHYAPGVTFIPQDATSAQGDLIAAIEFGPHRTIAQPTGRGVFAIRNPQNSDEYSFSQQFIVEDATITYKIRSINFARIGTDVVLDAQQLQSLFISGTYETPEINYESLRLQDCYYEGLPLWQIDVELEGNRSVTLHQRYQPPLAGSGPAMLTMGHVVFPEASVTTTNYWDLVYSADHHNWNERFWVLFSPPVGEQYGVGVYQHLFDYMSTANNEDANGRQQPALSFEPHYTALLLDSAFQPLQPLEVLSYRKFEITVTPTVTATLTVPPTETPLPTDTPTVTPTDLPPTELPTQTPAPVDTPTPTHPLNIADFNEDGRVDVLDLLMFIGRWQHPVEDE